jgi:hypothetical protein
MELFEKASKIEKRLKFCSVNLGEQEDILIGSLLTTTPFHLKCSSIIGYIKGNPDSYMRIDIYIGDITYPLDSFLCDLNDIFVRLSESYEIGYSHKQSLKSLLSNSWSEMEIVPLLKKYVVPTVKFLAKKNVYDCMKQI